MMGAIGVENKVKFLSSDDRRRQRKSIVGFAVSGKKWSVWLPNGAKRGQGLS
jgi:hypothetical protein